MIDILVPFEKPSLFGSTGSGILGSMGWSECCNGGGPHGTITCCNGNGSHGIAVCCNVWPPAL